MAPLVARGEERGVPLGAGGLQGQLKRGGGGGSLEVGLWEVRGKSIPLLLQRDTTMEVLLTIQSNGYTQTTLVSSFTTPPPTNTHTHTPCPGPERHGPLTFAATGGRRLRIPM